mgnify:CR=1 FL=1|jgi:hypothetical protein
MSNETVYPENSILVIESSRTTEFNPINQQYGAIYYKGRSEKFWEVMASKQ